MEVLTAPQDVSVRVQQWRADGLEIGLVPTMGALHDGHRSLITHARAANDRVIVSIFVNPKQFGRGEDFNRYPRDMDRDIGVLREERVDLLFTPHVDDMYGDGFATRISLGGELTESLEGAARPGHFDGVALVVAKLLIAVHAHRAYFGEKDAQQCAVVRRLATDLDIPTHIVVCPTVRESDGLALSSRNVYLSSPQRREALAISRGLQATKTVFDNGERRPAELRGAVLAELARASGLEVEYVAVVDADTFAAVSHAMAGNFLVVAVRVGETRLIDSLRLDEKHAAL